MLDSRADYRFNIWILKLLHKGKLPQESSTDNSIDQQQTKLVYRKGTSTAGATKSTFLMGNLSQIPLRFCAANARTQFQMNKSNANLKHPFLQPHPHFTDVKMWMLIVLLPERWCTQSILRKDIKSTTSTTQLLMIHKVCRRLLQMIVTNTHHNFFLQGTI